MKRVRLESNEEILQRAAAKYGRVPLHVKFQVTDPCPVYDPHEVPPPPAEPVSHTLPTIKVGDIWVGADGWEYCVVKLPHPRAKKQWVYSTTTKPNGDKGETNRMKLILFQKVAAAGHLKTTPPPPKPKKIESAGAGKLREMRGNTVHFWVGSPEYAHAVMDLIAEVRQFFIDHHRLPNLS
jgi:hypothetical protein